MKKSIFKKSKTNRGFPLIESKDLYGAGYSIQESSLATQAAIWLGIDDAKPQIMASKTEAGGNGWVDYPLLEDVSLTTRMHLNRKQVFKLLLILIKFVLTGHL